MLTLSLSDRGEPRWRADYRGITAIAESPLGLRCGPLDFTGALTVAGVGSVRKTTEAYQLFTGPRRRVKTDFRERTVALRNAAGALLELDLRCTDGGVALRYRIPRPAGDPGQPLPLAEERTGFALPPGDAWLLPYHQPGPYTPAYEDLYQAVKVGEPPGKCRGPGPADGWSFPALFRLHGGRLWALLCESGVDETFCGSHLSAGEGGLYALRFPLAGEMKRSVPALGQSPAQPASSLPWTTPWRAVVLAGDAGGILTSTLPTDLAAPCRVADTSWIRPGRASWSWLSISDRFDRDTFHTFLDLAAERGWEYSLLDAGWWNVPLQEMAADAKSKGVRLLLWGDSTEMYDPVERRRRLDEAAELGIAGFKIDFWSSDKQLAVQTMLDLCRDAAARRLVIVLHGCTVPRGWQRTWPNLLAAEAVLGEESYLFDGSFAEQAPAHHTILPFTRNVMGPMDYTPAVLTGSPWRHLVTDAHQLALPILFTAGVQCYGGHVDWYHKLPPEALALVASVPAVWDESRCLQADPGRSVAVARRSGTTWYLAAINGTAEPLELRLDLRRLGKGGHWTALADGADGLTVTTGGGGWPAGDVRLAPFGGWVARVESHG